MLKKSFIIGALLFSFWATQATDAQTLRQWNYPPGSCPPGSSPTDTDIPEQIPEAHYFPARLASEGHPGVKFALSLSRRACGASIDPSELRLRLLLPPGVAEWRPRLMIVQDGIEHGCAGVNWPSAPVSRFPGECSGANGLFVPPAPQIGNCGLFAANCVGSEALEFLRLTRLEDSRSVTLSLNNLSTSFDPARAFTIRVRGNWPRGSADAVYEIPAQGAVGNVARIPRNITGMWWNPDEPGTAVIIDRNERGATFAAWLTFGDDGKSIWFAMTNGTAIGTGMVEGTAFSIRGQPFSIMGANQAFAAEGVGKFTLHFSNSNRAELRWSVLGHSGVQRLQRFTVRNARGDACGGSGGVQRVREIAQAGDLMGWALQMEGSPSEFTGCAAHTTLLTFDEEGRAMWIFGSVEQKIERLSNGASLATEFADLYRPAGSPYSRQYDASQFRAGDPAGTWGSHPAGRQITLSTTTRAVSLHRFHFEY